jgi:tagaturonate reductase
MLLPLNDHNIPSRPTFPDKIIQFGGGNFLRAFADWMVDILNGEAGLEAGVVIVKPTPNGSYDELKAQDGLFHVRLTGGDSTAVRLIGCVNRVVNPYTDFDDYLSLAQETAVRFILSNTTEAGIAFDASDRLADRPASSFPAKLTQFLYSRYRYFEADPTKGCIILPCELVEQNGTQLRRMVIDYADLWQLESGFKAWLDNACAFCNTLVDRIVSGFPKEKAAEIQQIIGYDDHLLVEAESYHQWIIDGPDWVAAELPIKQTNLNIHFVNDLAPYRTLKVRILNGAHTSMTPVGFLCDLETVREVVEDELVGRFISSLLAEEVLPTLDFPPAERQSYMNATLQRFQNPELHHRLLDIALNSLSKFRVRLLPSLLAYQTIYGRPPERIVFSMAALVYFYRGQRGGEGYAVRDDSAVLAWFNKLWQSPPSWPEMARLVLQQESFWGQDLTAVPGLPERLDHYLQLIAEIGSKASLIEIANGQ